jgi:hypothetical protein
MGRGQGGTGQDHDTSAAGPSRALTLVVGRPPPRGEVRRREGQNLGYLLGVVVGDTFAQGAATAARPTGSRRAGSTSRTGATVAWRGGPGTGERVGERRVAEQPHADPIPLAPDSLVLIRKDRMPVVDAHIRAGGDVPDASARPTPPTASRGRSAAASITSTPSRPRVRVDLKRGRGGPVCN